MVDDIPILDMNADNFDRMYEALTHTLVHRKYTFPKVFYKRGLFLGYF